MTPWIALEALTHPGWLLDYVRSGGFPVMQTWAPYAPEGATAEQVADVFGRLTPNPMTNRKMLEKIRSLWRGNLVVKGILHPEDARLVVETGADAIIVKTIGLVRAEIDLVMAQIGCTRLDALHAGYPRRAGADYTALANLGQNPGPAA